MTLFEQFKSRFVSIYNESVASESTMPAKAILAGADFQTAYFQWLLEECRLASEPILFDDKACIYGKKIYRELALDDLNRSIRKFVGFVPGGEDRYYDMFKRHGIPTVSLEEKMGCKKFGFYEWLEANYGVDLVQTIAADKIVGATEHTTASGPSRQMGLTDVFSCLDPEGKRFLDIGSGKGGAMVIANQFPFEKVNGLEISIPLCNIAKENLYKLGYNGRILNHSATTFDGYRDYDILYMYDPFRGEMFEEAIAQIENSIGNKPVVLIYANPYHHNDVVKHGVFEFVSYIDTDFFHRNVKFYVANGAEIPWKNISL